MERDRIGRRRRPEQERGLRPLHPPLPPEWLSKVLRVAMSEADWELFEAMVARRAERAPSQAQAHGLVLSELIQAAPHAEMVFPSSPRGAEPKRAQSG